MTDRRSNVPPVTSSPERDEASVTMSRGAFAAWLRAAREGRGIGLEEIARVTKIQLRTLERLEEARFDELPADVFVRGFIKNYARVVGLDANEALARYDDCGVSPGPAATARAKAMADLFEPEPRNKYAQGTPPQGTTLKPTPLGTMASGSLQMPAVAIDPFVIPTGSASSPSIAIPVPQPTPAPVIEAQPEPAAQVEPTEPPEPPEPKRGKGRRRKNESKKRTTAKTAAKKITAPAPGSAIEVVDLSELEPEIEVIFEPEPAPAPIPTLVIDDADPDSAEREQEMRAREKDKEKEKRSFLPQALLDNDRGSRQGGLTLAVIILLIVATLTLSYLMRRPSSSGEGVTMLPEQVTLES